MTDRQRARLREQVREDQFEAEYREGYLRPLAADLRRLLRLYGYGPRGARRVARQMVRVVREDDGE